MPTSEDCKQSNPSSSFRNSISPSNHNFIKKKLKQKKESAGSGKMKLPTINGTGDSGKSPRKGGDKGTLP